MWKTVLELSPRKWWDRGLSWEWWIIVIVCCKLSWWYPLDTSFSDWVPIQTKFCPKWALVHLSSQIQAPQKGALFLELTWCVCGPAEPSSWPGASNDLLWWIENSLLLSELSSSRLDINPTHWTAPGTKLYFHTEHEGNNWLWCFCKFLSDDSYKIMLGGGGERRLCQLSQVSISSTPNYP